MTDLPFEPASFDHVLSWNVIYHGDESVVRRTLAEVARVLRPGGSFMATMLSARRLPVEQAKARGARSAATPGSSTGEGDKVHPHYFCTAPDLLSLMWGSRSSPCSTGRMKSPGPGTGIFWRSVGMSAELIEGARVILDDRVETASVRIEGGRITGIDVARDGAQ
jgi:SAM-dependent methyltransferase